MPLISRNSIEEIKDRVDMVDALSPYVTLKRVGAHWRGLSPFTSEKTPSFYVMPEKGIFKCFSSGYAGDIFRFFQLKENLSFQEAVETVAHRFNIVLEYEEQSAQAVQSVSLKKELYEIHELAADFFHYKLLKNNTIRDYWEHVRHFSLKVAEEFKIGFAPEGKFELIEYLFKKRTFSHEALEKCGLFYVREHGPRNQRYIGRFRGRLMISIRDVQERIIGFAGRKLEQTPEDDPAFEAKYINSPETPVFNKSRILFGLERARKFINDQVGYFVLVEGQLDVIRCWSCGIDTAIAPQGTSVTEQQLNLLRRYAPKLFCVLDGDAAGQKAALRIIPLCLKADIDVHFIVLREGEDPDVLLEREGAEAIVSKLPEAKSFVQFASEFYFKKEGTVQEKNEGLKALYELLVLSKSAVAREEYLLELAKITHVSRQNIELDFARYHKKKNATFSQKQEKNIAFSQDKGVKDKLISAECQLLLLILNHEDIAFSLSYLVDLQWIDPSSIEGGLLIKILNEIREELWTGQKHIHELLENEQERNFVYSILGDNTLFEDPVAAANIILKNLYKKFLNKEKARIEQEIIVSSPEDFNTLRSLQEKRIQIRNQLNNPPQLPALNTTSI